LETVTARAPWTIVFYISSHGLGHASRSIELIRELQARRPQVRIIVRTSAPGWLFEPAALRIERSETETDVGVAQVNSLSVDEDETIRRALVFYGGFERRVAAEAEWLQRSDASLVLGDIPPLAFAAAARAEVPSVAIANFTWDWIYAGYDRFKQRAPQIIDAIAAAYATATRALRLPLHGGFDSMARVTADIPFIARRSSRDRAETRDRLGISADRPLVLACFSANDLVMPYDRIAEAERLTVLAPPREPPAPLTYPDLVAAADVVISKPGYGIVSECIANGTPLLYTSRGRFAEYDVFVSEMPGVLKCRYIAQTDLLAGRWHDAVNALLAQPSAPTPARVDGAAVAANEILNLVIE
jgi:L-arabinokinase